MTGSGNASGARALRVAVGLLLACSVLGCGGSNSKRSDDDLAAHLDLSSANLTRMVADPGRPYVYVSDAAANAVHFLNTDTYRIDRTIAVGSNPGAMDMKPDGSVLFVALHGGSSIAVVDLSEKTLRSPIAVPGTPEAIAIGSNDRLYVSVHGDSLSVFDVSSLPAASAGTVSNGSWGITLAGGTADRSRIFTHDTSTSLALTEWTVSVTTATQVATANICSGPPLISSSPDGATFAFVQDASYFDTRWPLEDGDVPIFRTADMLRAGTVNVQWNPVAVAMCPVTGRIVVAHSDTVVNPTTTTRHSQGTGDLHAFDGATYVETSRYHLRNRVKAYGITCGPDGRIYVILGAEAGTAIGVIEP